MSRADSRVQKGKIPLTVVEGGGAGRARRDPLQEADRWKGWVAVLLAVIFILVTVHMDGPTLATFSPSTTPAQTPIR